VKEANPSEPVQVTIPGGRVSRRAAMQWVMTAVAASSLPTGPASGADQPPTPPSPVQPPSSGGLRVPAPPGAPSTEGYGTDPNLIDVHEPGAIWPLTLTPAQRRTTVALADVILPKDELGPAASAVGVPDMIDEWISAPYPTQRADRPVILDGLAWVDAQSNQRFTKSFADLADDQKRAICDDVCFAPAAKPEFKKAAASFSRFRALAAGAYYSTMEGWKAIGYVGNVPLQQFDGPPAEVLERLGVTQTVK
jgi:hypothetical protein